MTSTPSSRVDAITEAPPRVSGAKPLLMMLLMGSVLVLEMAREGCRFFRIR
jgi:hypothetical protein